MSIYNIINTAGVGVVPPNTVLSDTAHTNSELSLEQLAVIEEYEGVKVDGGQILAMDLALGSFESEDPNGICNLKAELKRTADESLRDICSVIDTAKETLEGIQKSNPAQLREYLRTKNSSDIGELIDKTKEDLNGLVEEFLIDVNAEGIRIYGIFNQGARPYNSASDNTAGARYTLAMYKLFQKYVQVRSETLRQQVSHSLLSNIEVDLYTCPTVKEGLRLKYNFGIVARLENESGWLCDAIRATVEPEALLPSGRAES